MKIINLINKNGVTLHTENKYCNEDIAVWLSDADSTNLVASNIKSGVDILGIEGTFTSDGTAAAGDMLSGKIAYVKGSKVTGTIVTKTSSNVTTSGAKVSIPAGYYSSAVTKTIGTGSATTPATTITVTPTISIDSSGKITASSSTTKSVTPTVSAGYVSTGTAGTITVSCSNTKQLTTKAATTYTPSTSNQTIASGTYLTGTQTIKGDSYLKAANIKAGVTIFGIQGTYTGETYSNVVESWNYNTSYGKKKSTFPWGDNITFSIQSKQKMLTNMSVTVYGSGSKTISRSSSGTTMGYVTVKGNEVFLRYDNDTTATLGRLTGITEIYIKCTSGSSSDSYTTTISRV